MSAISEIEDLFGTKAKNNVIYFNDVTYTPIPRPIVEAVKNIMFEYPDMGCQIGLYSVKVFDKNIKPQTNPHSKLVENGLKKKESDSSKIGKIHDTFVMGDAAEPEVIDRLKEVGLNKTSAERIIDKWRPSVIKQSLSQFFPVSEEEAEEIDELEKKFTDRSELRSVLEDYFHLYDDYAKMEVDEFNQCLADYFEDKTEIKSAFFQEGEECVIEINENGKWEFVSLDNTPEGWSTRKSAKVFPSVQAAKESALMKRLKQAGYSEENQNLRISAQ